MYVSGVVHGENDSRLEDTVRVVRRRHLDEATRTGESNEIDDQQAGMALTKAERLEPTAACSGGACDRMAKTLSPETGTAASDDSKLTEVEKPDRTVAAAAALSSSAVDEETSQSQYYYEYVGPTKSFPGEAKRASSRGRSLVPTEPNTARPPPQQQQQQTDATQHQTRKAGNSEMEDILDGFVKLLNGQPAQPSYRQPIKTRINNRGPPRIAEAPPVPMETPTFVPMPQHQHQPPSPPPQVKPKDPPPYPFDVPHSVRPLPPQPPNIVRPFLTGVPLPEQLVPTIGGDHVDDDDLGPPSLYDHQSTVVTNAASRRPVYQTAKPQQEYDLFASHANGGNGATTAESVTEKFATITPPSPSPPPLSLPSPPPPSLPAPALTQPERTTEKPTSTEKPSTPVAAQPVSDINATRVIGLQVSKIVDHLTSPAMPVVGRENSTTTTSTTASTTTTSTTKINSVSTESSATTPTRPDTTLHTGEQVTGVGSAVVVLEPSTSEEPHHEEAHKPTENKLPSGKPTTPIKKTSQQSGNYKSRYKQ